MFFNKNEFKKAKINFEKSLSYFKKKDNLVLTNNMIGRCYLYLKDYKLAQKYAEKALKLNPNYEDAKELLEDCKKQRRR